MSETPPAAWYPDPEVPGQQRYWDGTVWTEYRAPSARKKHPIRWAIIGGAILLVILAVGLTRDFITGTDSVIRLQVGECLDNNPDTYGTNDEVEKVKLVPCSGQHYSEVFYVYKHPTTEKPGSQGYDALAAATCQEHVLDYFANAADDPSLRLFMFNPTASTWGVTTDCMLYQVDESTGAAKTVKGPLNAGN